MGKQLSQLLPLVLLAFPVQAGCSADLRGDPSDQSQGPGSQGDPSTAAPGGNPGSLGIGRQAVSSACEERNGELGVGITKLRRLSSAEFNNTIQSLFGGEHIDYKAQLPKDEPMGPFVSNQTLAVRAQEARQYSLVAEQVAEQLLAQGQDFLGCSLGAGGDSACIEQFIAQTVPRAFRRPLHGGEAARLLELYALGRDGIEGDAPDPAAGLRLLLRAVVGSPDLLYVVDRSQSGVVADIPELVDAHTLASRLSLAIWNGPPDGELFQLAVTDELLKGEVYQAQVERLLADPRARDNLARIFAELTGVDELIEHEKDAVLFPQYDQQLIKEMLAEQSSFVQNVVFDQNGLWSTLLTTNYSQPSPRLTELYGASESPQGAVFPQGQRQGLFTQAAYLSAHNKASETSPVHLGINIREAILCETMQPPPANINTTLPEVTGDIKTSRDRFAAHETGPCKNCHQLIDPIGLAFENYDAIGAYRTTDNGAEIDPTGQIINSQGGEDGPWFTGALELSQQLADSPQVQDCISRQMLRALLTRQESTLDACTVLSVIETFDASQGNLLVLLKDIANTDAFKHILLNPPGTTP